MLNPIVIRLGKFKISRTLATILILSAFLAIVSVLSLLIIPPLYRELAELAEQAPNYIDSLWEKLRPYFEMAEQSVADNSIDQSISEAVGGNVSGALSASANILEGLISGGRALVELLTFIVVTPLVAFFMMIEWPNITSWIDNVLPRHNHAKVKQLLAEIDKKIAGFIRGQLLVALSLGMLYSLALTLVGLEFGFLIGLMAGMLSVIPLFGSTVGLVTSAGMAWLQNGDLAFIAAVVGIFALGQFLEGNFITPKLIGKSVSLHPLWILFSLMAGAALFGIVGMIIAVPVAATARVLLGFGLEQYRKSDYYT